jgi:cbb3-type cytochrome oxidase maturation protein
VDILFVLLPLSVALVLAILALFAWALRGGQFEDLEREGQRLLEQNEDDPVAEAGRRQGARG